VNLFDEAPRRLTNLPAQHEAGWGAFMLYLGVDQAVIPDDYPLHHQVIDNQPLGEGNTAFISISPDWDHSRAPAGKRAVTVSTHTDLHRWWDLYEKDLAAYQSQKKRYTARLLELVERILPGAREAIDLLLPGTPVSFQRFTRRRSGWVGGFPQTSLLRSWSPRLEPGVWMVGDSIFPGQSIAATALGGLRVANMVSREHSLN